MSKRKHAAMFDHAALNSGPGDAWLDKTRKNQRRAAKSVQPVYDANGFRELAQVAQTEHQIQVACVNWFRKQHPGLLLFAIPNGEARTPATGAKLKQQGVLAGVADLLLLYRGTAYFIEMKKPGGSQSATQRKFEVQAVEAGGRYFVCKTLAEFQALVGQIITGAV